MPPRARISPFNFRISVTSLNYFSTDAGRSVTLTPPILHSLREKDLFFAKYAARAVRFLMHLVRIVRSCATRDASTCTRAHARGTLVSCSAGLVTTRVTVLIYLIWLTTNLSRDSLVAMDSRAIAPAASPLCARCECRRIFPADRWLAILFLRGNIPSTGIFLALTAYVTLISGQNVISDSEREFVFLSSCDTFEAWTSLALNTWTNCWFYNEIFHISSNVR